MNINRVNWLTVLKNSIKLNERKNLWRVSQWIWISSLYNLWENMLAGLPKKRNSLIIIRQINLGWISKKSHHSLLMIGRNWLMENGNGLSLVIERKLCLVRVLRRFLFNLLRWRVWRALISIAWAERSYLNLLSIEQMLLPSHHCQCRRSLPYFKKKKKIFCNRKEK